MYIKAFSIVIILLLNSQMFCQSISEELKNQIYSYLGSEKSSVVNAGVDYVIEFKLYDAIPILDSIIWRNKVPVQLSILWAMAYLKSENTVKFALAFIDSIDHYEGNRFYGNENKSSAKSHVNLAMFYIKDYTKADFVLQQLRIDPYDDESIWLIPDLVRNLPKYEHEAKNILFNAANNSEDYRNRFNAVHQLEELYGAEMIPLYLSFFKNIEESREVYDYTRIASFEYLCKYNYHNLENIIKEQLYIEPAASYKIDFIEVLLDRFKTKENVKFIEEFCKREKDELVTESIGYILDKIKDEDDSPN